MWDFLQYTSRKRAFNSLFRGSSEAARVRTGARASKTALRIYCKPSSEYLGTLVVAAGNFGPGGLLGRSEISDLEVGGEPKRAIEGATKGRSWRERLRPRTEIISI